MVDMSCCLYCAVPFLDVITTINTSPLYGCCLPQIQCNVFDGADGEVALTAAGGLRKIPGLNEVFENAALVLSLPLAFYLFLLLMAILNKLIKKEYIIIMEKYRCRCDKEEIITKVPLWMWLSSKYCCSGNEI